MKYLFVFCFVLFIVGCDRFVFVEGVVSESLDGRSHCELLLLGTVVNHNQKPIADALVVINGYYEVYTDKDGKFREKVLVSLFGTPSIRITCAKEGYLAFTRKFIVSSSDLTANVVCYMHALDR